MSDSEEEEEEEPSLLPMELTNEELEWALALKREVMEDETLEERPDFEYAQVTLVCMDDLDSAKYRLKALQDFREEYEISDTAVEGMELVVQFMQQQPWFVLDVHVDERHSVLAQDFSVLDPSKVRSPAEWRIFLGGFYYFYQILQPNLFSIREGILCVGEMHGIGWKNFDVNFMQRHFDHLLEYYPMIIKESRLIHSSAIGNILQSMLKKLRTGVRNSPIEIGCQLDELQGGRLEDIFKIPTEEAAQTRLIQKCAEYLTTRYNNRESYRLPETSYGTTASFDTRPTVDR